ncbi:LOW QUALITY PROTEIN: hypothetical protein ACHAW6_012633 [Cyclotella cf. meneghiniana]
MGLKCSPHIVQLIIKIVLAGIDDEDVYIDDDGEFSQIWDHHVNLLSNHCITYMKIVSLLTHLNVNGPSKKLTGWAYSMGSKNLKKMLSSTWIALELPLNCACSMVVLTTEIFGKVVFK